MMPQESDLRAEEGIPVEVKLLDNGGYYDAFLMDVFEDEAIIHFPMNWIEETRLPLSLIRFPPDKNMEKVEVKENMVAEAYMHKQPGIYKGWFKCLVKLLKSKFCQFEYLGDHSGIDFVNEDMLRPFNDKPSLSWEMLHFHVVPIPEEIQAYANIEGVHKGLKAAIKGALINYDSDNHEVIIISPNKTDISRAKILEKAHLRFLTQKTRVLQLTGKLDRKIEIAENGQFVAEFTISDNLIGVAIGRDKANLRAVKNIEGISNVQFVRKSNKFIIHGETEKAVSEARELLEIRMEYYFIPESEMSQLVGRNSENIYTIVEATGAVEIFIPKSRDVPENHRREGFLPLAVVGTSKAIIRAKFCIDFQLDHIYEVLRLRKKRMKLIQDINNYFKKSSNIITYSRTDLTVSDSEVVQLTSESASPVREYASGEVPKIILQSQTEANQQLDSLEGATSFQGERPNALTETEQQIIDWGDDSGKHIIESSTSVQNISFISTIDTLELGKTTTEEKKTLSEIPDHPKIQENLVPSWLKASHFATPQKRSTSEEIPHLSATKSIEINENYKKNELDEMSVDSLEDVSTIGANTSQEVMSGVVELSNSSMDIKIEFREKVSPVPDICIQENVDQEYIKNVASIDQEIFSDEESQDVSNIANLLITEVETFTRENFGSKSYQFQHTPNASGDKSSSAEYNENIDHLTKKLAKTKDQSVKVNLDKLQQKKMHPQIKQPPTSDEAQQIVSADEINNSENDSIPVVEDIHLKEIVPNTTRNVVHTTTILNTYINTQVPQNEMQLPQAYMPINTATVCNPYPQYPATAFLNSPVRPPSMTYFSPMARTPVNLKNRIYSATSRYAYTIRSHSPEIAYPHQGYNVTSTTVRMQNLHTTMPSSNSLSLASGDMQIPQIKASSSNPPSSNPPRFASGDMQITEAKALCSNPSSSFLPSSNSENVASDDIQITQTETASTEITREGDPPKSDHSKKMKVIELLQRIGYEGPMLNEPSFKKAIKIGLSSPDYNQLMIYLTEEIHKFKDITEHITPMTNPVNSNIFSVELGQFLREINCPYSELLANDIASRLQTSSKRRMLIKFFAIEIICNRLLQNSAKLIELENYMIQKDLDFNVNTMLNVLNIPLGPSEDTFQAMKRAFINCIGKQSSESSDSSYDS